MVASNFSSLLYQVLGFSVRDENLFWRAFCHKSFTDMMVSNYERMEFLGDRILNLAVADLLYDLFPEDTEGNLALRLNKCVSRQNIAQIGFSIGLDRLIMIVGGKVAEDLIAKSCVVSDTFESLLACIYKEKGFNFTKDYVAGLLGKQLTSDLEINPRSFLQEWAQGKGLPLPVYHVLSKTGFDHAPFFQVSVCVEGYDPCIGEGGSKNMASLMAADLFLRSYNLLKEDM